MDLLIVLLIWGFWISVAVIVFNIALTLVASIAAGLIAGVLYIWAFVFEKITRVK